MANRVKTISKYSGSAWGTEVPIGADATNVDMTTAPSDYDSSSSETSKVLIGTNDVKAISTDTDLTAWGKFNRFRRRVSNKFADYFATANLTGSSAGVTSTGDDNHAYTTAALNAYFNTVVGYSSAADVSEVGSVASQLSSLNSNMTSVISNADRAISSISRDGTTFTATRYNGSTFTFTQQDKYPGYYHYNSGTKSVAANTVTTLTSVTCEEGFWLIVGYIDLKASYANTYNIMIKFSDGNVQNNRAMGNNGGGANNVWMGSLPAGTVTLQVYVGQSMNAFGWLRAIALY